jgi:hypothetical protein
MKTRITIAAALTIALTLLLPISAPTQTALDIQVSSSGGTTTLSVSMPDAAWSEITQAYADLNGSPADPEAFTLGRIRETVVREWNLSLAGADEKNNPRNPSKVQ